MTMLDDAGWETKAGLPTSRLLGCQRRFWGVMLVFPGGNFDLALAEVKFVRDAVST